MGADGTYNGISYKATLTEGQPISYNGTTINFWGQIGYLSIDNSTISIYFPVWNVTMNFSDPQTMVKYEQMPVSQGFDWLPVIISVVTVIGIVIFA